MQTTQTIQPTNWIASRLSDGLGNRLFQIAAGLRAAEIHSRPYVFFLPRMLPSVHGDCTILRKLFPQIPIIHSAHAWKTVEEQAYTLWTYQPTLQSIIPHDPCVFHGYYQSELYLPQKTQITLDFENALTPLRCKELRDMYKLTTESDSSSSASDSSSAYTNTWFLHIRLGDYMQLPHHQIPLQPYITEALRHVPSTDTILLTSDSPTIALNLIPPTYRYQIIQLSPTLNHIETLYIMSQCTGGCIGTNSTFSWWGAYLSKARQAGKPCFFPSPWHNTIPNQKDVYSPWMTVIDTMKL
jgi:hypothetical protein